MRASKSESAEYPVLLDTESSPLVVYRRSNVEEIEKIDESGNKHPWFIYTEIVYTREEWERLQETNHLVDLDFRVSMLELGL